MVLEYYNLREQPFGVTPDRRYLYASATHREALASLLYGLEAGRGFVALIAQPGMGKTTLLFQALDRLKDKARVVFVFQTICTPVDFLRTVLTDLGVHDTRRSLIELQSKLNEVVTEQSRSGKPLVLVIDEAQNLDDSVLELVRMLSNFETSREKLIQIVLSGQPQLADKLASPEFVQLRQRISIFGCLKPFSPVETALYIEHRLQVAGSRVGTPLFTSGALALIAEHSGGVPRNINNLCFNAMSLGCALHRRMIDREIISEVIADLDLEALQARTSLARRPGGRWRTSSPGICLCYEYSVDADGLGPEIHRSLRNPDRPWRGALSRPSLDDGEDCRTCEPNAPTTDINTRTLFERTATAAGNSGKHSPSEGGTVALSDLYQEFRMLQLGARARDSETESLAEKSRSH